MTKMGNRDGVGKCRCINGTLVHHVLFFDEMPGGDIAVRRSFSPKAFEQSESSCMDGLCMGLLHYLHLFDGVQDRYRYFLS